MNGHVLAQVRDLRQATAGGGATAYPLPAPRAGAPIEVQVTAIDLGAEPPLHTVAILSRSGLPTGATIENVIAVGRGPIAVGTILAAQLFVDGRWMLLAGAGGSGSGATGAILPHSHLGGADGPIIGILG